MLTFSLHVHSAPCPAGKVVIDAFRMIPDGGGMMGMLMPQAEPRQTTSHVGFLKRPTIQAQIHGLNKYYYSIVLDWRKNDLEEQVRAAVCCVLCVAYICSMFCVCVSSEVCIY